MEPKTLTFELLPLEFTEAVPPPVDQAVTIAGDLTAEIEPPSLDFELPKLEMVGFDAVEPTLDSTPPKLEMLESEVTVPSRESTLPKLAMLDLVDDTVAGTAASAATVPKSTTDEILVTDVGVVNAPSAEEMAAIAAVAPNPDKYLAEAIKEISVGQRDEPLWTWAFAQGAGNQTAAIGTYLRARATALRVLDRNQRAERRARATKAADTARDEAGEAKYNARPTPKAKARLVPAIAGAMAVLIAGGWFFSASWGNRADQAAALANPAPVVSPAAVAAQAAAAAAASKAAAEAEAGASPEFLAKVEALHAAGNWNVLVLHAVEWTRREPQNAAAWNELSFGYAQLRQFRDAGDAAGKAVALAPKDPHYWSSLGGIKLDLNEPVEALRAFEEATILDALDVRSFVQAGILHAQLGHPTEAKSALDRAMALSPDYPGALCLKALTAQRPVAQKEASTTKVKLADGKCVASTDAQALAVQAIPVKPAPRR